MARRSAKKKRLEKRTATILVLILSTVLMAALLMAAPSIGTWLKQALGITRKAVVPIANSSSAVGIHIINIGQGDAVLLEDNGKYALIDTGPRTSQDMLITYLNTVGVKRLEYAIMTHPHEDHMGNMQAVLEHFEVDKLILPDLEKAPYPTTSFFLSLLEAALEKNIPTSIAHENDVYPLGSGTITILQNGLRTEDNYNLLSLIVLFESEGLRFLNTGDAEKPNEESLQNSLKNIRADVYMAGHHGSSTSNSANFLRTVRPALVVISCGLNNSYGHPHREPLATFAEIGATVLRTDQNGSIVIRPNGNSIAYGCEIEEATAPAA